MSDDEVQKLREELQALRSRLLIYEKAVSTIADGFLIVARDGTILEINKAYCDYFGVEREETLGKSVLDVIPNTKMLEIMDNVLHEVDYMHRFPAGQTTTGEKMVAVSRMPVMDGDKVIASAALVKFSRYTITLANTLKKLEEEVDYYRKTLRSRGMNSFGFADIPCLSDTSTEAMRLAMRFASSDLPILLLGETGAGKEVFANAIHMASERRNGPFVAVNCASIPAELLESELFGYTDGAFTGSRKGGMKGKFELANGGTLFLDEIGDMPLAMQSKLLRVLQCQEVEKLGCEKRVSVDVRILAATNQDLGQKVEANLFRSDLFYRLDVLTVKIPPLRERKNDMSALVSIFLDELNAKYGRNVSVPPETLFLFTVYHWPGNVRELRNVIGRSFMLAEGEHILPEHLPPHIANSAPVSAPICTIAAVKAEKERDLILSCLNTYSGNVSKAAKALGIHRATLYTKIQAFGIPMQQFRDSANG